MFQPLQFAFVFGQPGMQEMMIVGIIALLLFGKRLPEVARNLGKGFSEFKKGMSGIQDDFRNAASDSDRRVSYSSQTTTSNENRPATPDAAVPADDEFAAPKFDAGTNVAEDEFAAPKFDAT
ncbi:MAG: twin-arginine translocase TatA/TatE family subunit [Planctomycetaceae bacterium]|nr:twin-arginine translocase TatA/TatE family subunit [Planctomycetaceae bacterium]